MSCVGPFNAMLANFGETIVAEFPMHAQLIRAHCKLKIKEGS